MHPAELLRFGAICPLHGLGARSNREGAAFRPAPAHRREGFPLPGGRPMALPAGAGERPGKPGWPEPAWPGRTGSGCCSWWIGHVGAADIGQVVDGVLDHVQGRGGALLGGAVQVGDADGGVGVPDGHVQLVVAGAGVADLQGQTAVGVGPGRGNSLTFLRTVPTFLCGRIGKAFTIGKGNRRHNKSKSNHN